MPNAIFQRLALGRPLVAIDAGGGFGGGEIGLQLLLIAGFPDAFAGFPIDGDDVFGSAHDDDVADGNRPCAGNCDNAALDEVVAAAGKERLDAGFVDDACFPARPQMGPAAGGLRAAAGVAVKREPIGVARGGCLRLADEAG